MVRPLAGVENMLRSDRASSAESGPNGVVSSPSRENPDLCLLGPLEGHLTGSVSDGDQPLIDSTVANLSKMWEHQRVSRSHAITFDPIVTTCALHQQATSFELLLRAWRDTSWGETTKLTRNASRERPQRKVIDLSQRQ